MSERRSRVRPTQEELTLLAKVTPPGEEVHSQEEIFARLAWNRLTEPGDRVAGGVVSTLGAATALDLLVSDRSATHIREQLLAQSRGESQMLSSPELKQGLERWRPRLSREGTLRDLQQAVHHKMKLLSPSHTLWPKTVNDLGAHAPLVLWVQGDAQVLHNRALAIVGARNTTTYGTQTTALFAQSAARLKHTIVSGAAFGVDAVAHRGALAHATPTAAVLAGGLDRVYPLAHEELLKQIRQAGVLISEMIPGAAPTRWRFLQRNRLIAALSRATLVTEAGIRSGAINTAGHAATLGRELGAVPGPITSPTSHGCFRLLNDYNATMITSEEDLVSLLGVSDEQHGSLAVQDTSLHRRILDALPLRGKKRTQVIVRNSGTAPTDAAEALIELELLGKVKRHGSGGLDECEWSLLR